MQVGNALTIKGQVTIPKRVRDALKLRPGDEVDFVVDDRGAVVLQRAGGRRSTRPTATPDRFERALGSAPRKLGCSVDEYMNMIRGED